MIIFYAVVGVVIVYSIYAYNRLISLYNKVKSAWSDVDIQLKRRYDLIPNLVIVVGGYASHEKNLFEKVTRARTDAMSGNSPKSKEQSELSLSGGLKSIFAVAENYPDLKANQNFLSLQTELSEIENSIQSARRFYNGNVKNINTVIGMFPGNIIAKVLGFSEQEFFELDNDSAHDPVNVSL